MRFIVPITMLLMGCASFTRPQGISPQDAGDRTAIVLGCEGLLVRGYQVCRFTEGQRFDDATIKVIVPFTNSITKSIVKFRAKTKAVAVEADGAIATILYSDLFDGQSFTKDMDGPVQIVITSVDDNGKRISMLGYLIFIILKPGYNPLPWSRDTECNLWYDASGRSNVQCDR